MAHEGNEAPGDRDGSDQVHLVAASWARWGSWATLIFLVLVPLIWVITGGPFLTLVGALPLIAGWWAVGPGRLLAIDVVVIGDRATVHRLAAPAIGMLLDAGSRLYSDARSRKIVWLEDRDGRRVRLHTGAMNIEPLIGFCERIEGMDVSVRSSSIRPPVL
jgi:hypothetical protein